MALNPPVLHQKPLKRSQSLDELRVSNGQPRYFDNKEGKLQGLHLANTSLKDKELADLLAGNDSSALEVLHIARNELTELTLTLPALTFLDARENKGLTTVDLSGCPKLEKVVLNRCAVVSLKLPESLSKLKQLEVANNRLTELSLGSDVESLRFLDVSDNQLTKLPLILKKSRADFYLMGSGNNFDTDITGLLLDKSYSDEERSKRLRNYLSEFKADDEEVDTLKIIFLGNTQAGKTTLADLLTDDNKADDGSTHGVHVFEKEIGATQVVGVDFGGQDYYHSIHFPLFNQRALYLLLWGNGQPDTFGKVENDKTKEEEDIYPLNYWLGAVEYFMREKSKLVRENKVWKNQNLHLYLINNQKRGANEEVADLNNRDLKENHGVDELYRFCLSKEESETAKAATKQEINRLIEKHKVKQTHHELDIKLRETIGKARDEGKVLLCIREFRESLTIEREEAKIKEALTILSYSVACHYLDETKSEKGDPFRQVLIDNFIVDLRAFTRWLYLILDPKKLRKDNRGGYFRKADAMGWLESTEAGNHLEYILAFMLHHKIIFEVKGRKDFYVVPQYLKPIEAGGVGELFLESFDPPLVKYEFDSYFHSNILAELIKCLYDDLLQEETGMKYIMWKNKVVLYDEPTEALPPPEQASEITTAQSEEKTVVEKGKKVVKEKQEMKKRFLFLDFQLPDADSQSKPTISLSRYAKKPVGDKFVQDIMEIIEKQIKYYEYTKWVRSPFGTYVRFDLLQQEKVRDTGNKKESDLIFDDRFIYRRGDFELFLPNEIFPMKKIFISYSHADESSKEEFKRHFVSLINENKVATFDDRELTMGGEWDPELKKKIDECDIMVCLVSVDFLNTGYIMKTEIPRAIEMGKTIVPIIVRPCDWTNTILGKYNGTLKGKVIALFEDRSQHDMPTFRSTSREERDMFWLEVVKEFRVKVF